MSSEIIRYHPVEENLQPQDVIRPPFTSLADYWKLTRSVWERISKIDQKRESDFKRKNPLRPNEDVEIKITSCINYGSQPEPIVFTSTHVNVFEPFEADRYFPWVILKNDLRKERQKIEEKWVEKPTEEQQAIDLLLNTLKYHYLLGENTQYCPILHLGDSLDNNGLSSEQRRVLDYCRLHGLPVVIESKLPPKPPLQKPREYFIGIDMKAFEDKLTEQIRQRSFLGFLKRR